MAVDWDRTAGDWQISSYADLGAGMIVAGFLSHFRFYGPSLKEAVHGVQIGGGGIDASVNAHGIVQLADKAASASVSLPALGMTVTPTCLRPFAIRELMICPVTVFNARIAAGIATADVKQLKFGKFFEARQAQATVKLAVDVGANWSAGTFVVFHPREYVNNTVFIESITRRKASDPLRLGGQKM